MSDISSLKQRKRSMYPYHLSYRTRWTDSDVYHHANNVVYYSLFDSLVNDYLIRHCGLVPAKSAYIGLMVHSSCDYFSQLAYPAVVDVGMRIRKLGKSSVTYEVAAFEGELEDDGPVAAVGELVHVYVESKTRRPTADGMPKEMREGLEQLLRQQARL